MEYKKYYNTELFEFKTFYNLEEIEKYYVEKQIHTRSKKMEFT